MNEQATVWLGLTVGTAAVTVWSVVFFRTLLDWRHHDERRVTWVMMAGTALIASIGTLSSSIGYGMQQGVIVLDIPQPVFSFVASFGRGALLMAGAIVLTHDRPPRVPR